jgi:hypothetical protein
MFQEVPLSFSSLGAKRGNPGGSWAATACGLAETRCFLNFPLP